jgi:PAS domain S-box-containing protein
MVPAQHPALASGGRHDRGHQIFAESLTPQLAAEAEARRWIDAFENAAFGITITDMRTVTIATANPAFAAILGKTVDEIRNATTTDIYPAEEIPRILACRERADRDGHAVIDTILLARDGRRLPVQLALTSVGHADGAIRYRIASVLDITERNRTEAALRQAQKMEAIGQLTGGIAHDFNNLLAIIIGNLDMAQAQLGGQPELHRLVGDGLDAALRGADLARRLLAFARLQPLQPERLQMNELIGRTVKLLDRILGENVPITFTPAPDLWPTLVDAAQVEAALINLATNARDAMPRGGKLTIASANRALDADYAAGRGRAHLRALLHHQGPGQGHRPGTQHGLRLHEAERRPCERL